MLRIALGAWTISAGIQNRPDHATLARETVKGVAALLKFRSQAGHSSTSRRAER